jgi:hypothetical protein
MAIREAIPHAASRQRWFLGGKDSPLVSTLLVLGLGVNKLQNSRHQTVKALKPE